MTEDWYVAAIDRVERAAQAACAALERTVEVLSHARDERMDGVPLVEIIDGLVARGGRDTRRGADAAFREYVDTVSAYRPPRYAPWSTKKG